MNNQALIVPTLQSPRLTLVPLDPTHSQGMFRLWSNDAVCRYSGPVHDYDGHPITTPVVSRDDSDRILNFWLRACENGWGFRWAVLLGAGGEFAGTAGFNALRPCAEYAYHLHPSYWGHGVMYEASVAALNWASDLCAEMELFVEPDNARSIALASRLGFSATDTWSHGARRYSKTMTVANSASRR